MKTIIIIFTLLFLHSLSAKEILKLAFVENSKIGEISFLVLKEAYKSINIDIEKKIFPNKRTLKKSNSGLADGEVNRIININKKFKNLLRVPVSINQLDALVISKNSDIEIKNWKSLADYKLGISRGVLYIEKEVKNMKVQKFNSNKRMFDLLRKNRLDFIIKSKINVLSYFKKTGEKEFKIHPNSIKSVKLFHYLHKKNEFLLKKITDALIKMQKKGRIQEIKNEYVKNLILKF